MELVNLLTLEEDLHHYIANCGTNFSDLTFLIRMVAYNLNISCFVVPFSYQLDLYLYDFEEIMTVEKSS